MKRHDSLFLLALVVGCGGKAQTSSAGLPNAGAANASGSASSGSANAGGDSSGGIAGAGQAQVSSCPIAEPTEGAACANRGQVCAGFGTLSCPDTAKCGDDGTWQIECPAMPLGPKCGCAHPIGNEADVPVPINHRVSGSECVAERAPLNPTPNTMFCPDPDAGMCLHFACSQDSDCKDGKNGRCVPASLDPGLFCSYDTCFSDEDCPKASVCACRASSADQAANVCTAPGSCRVDSDCGQGGFCSPSHAGPGQVCGSLAVYYCHTPQDTCLNDGDCGSQGLASRCNFDPAKAHWACDGGCDGAAP